MFFPRTKRTHIIVCHVACNVVLTPQYEKKVDIKRKKGMSSVNYNLGYPVFLVLVIYYKISM